MLLPIIVCVCVPVMVVMCGSHRSWAWGVIVVVCGALAVTVAARDVTALAGLPFYAWHGPMLASFALIVLGTLAGWVALKVDSPIGIGAMVGKLGQGMGGVRRRRSLAADVRRRVKDYRIEVA